MPSSAKLDGERNMVNGEKRESGLFFFLILIWKIQKLNRFLISADYLAILKVSDTSLTSRNTEIS